MAATRNNTSDSNDGHRSTQHRTNETNNTSRIDEWDEDDDDEPRWTDLQLAAEAGDVARVQALLASGREDVNAPPVGYYGRTALQAASLSGHKDVVLLLLEAGADVDARGGNNSMRTALQLACGEPGGFREGEEAEQDSVIGLLLAVGADVNAPAHRYNGRTALQAAAEGGYLRRVRWLRQLGADVNAPPSTTLGLTALQAACLSPGPVALVQALLDAGADVNAPPSRHTGLTALQAACTNSYYSAGRGGPKDRDSNLPVVELLLAAGADPNAPGSAYGGTSALHAAAYKGHADIVRCLLAAGADVNSPGGPRGQTPLKSALLHTRQECVDILREAGGTVNACRARFPFDC